MLSLPEEISIDVGLLERMQEENIVTSYKLFWFRGIFREITNRKKEITFRRIVCRMIVEAWYPLIEYPLNLGAIDMLYDLSMLIHKKYKIPSDILEDKLLDFLEDLKDKEVEKGIKDLYNMVPYRLLAPFFVGEFKGIPDHRRNKKLKKPLEDYLTINKTMDINALLGNEMPKDYFVDSIKSTIKPLFQIAYNQGYGLWHENMEDSQILTPTTIDQSLSVEANDIRLL